MTTSSYLEVEGTIYSVVEKKRRRMERQRRGEWRRWKDGGMEERGKGGVERKMEEGYN